MKDGKLTPTEQAGQFLRDVEKVLTTARHFDRRAAKIAITALEGAFASVNFANCEKFSPFDDYLHLDEADVCRFLSESIRRNFGLDNQTDRQLEDAWFQKGEKVKA